MTTTMRTLVTIAGRLPLPILCALFLLSAAGCAKKKEEPTCLLNVESVPEGAAVRINQREMGPTPLKIKVPRRAYLIEVSKLNYKTVWRNVSCLDATHKMELELQPVTASVIIESTPAKASVFIDGNQVGETPLIRHNLKVGDYSAILKKPGCSPKEATWTVKDARPQLVNVDLSSNTGTLAITTSPAGANLTINNEPRGKTPYKSQIEQGEYKLKLEFAGHSSYEDSVKVESGKETAKQYTLHILPGSVQITAEPAQAQLTLIDPQGKERIIGGSPATLEQLTPGDYVIKAELSPHFDTDTKAFSIQPGKKTEVSIKLEGNTGGIDIVANPPGVTVYLDGKKIGVTEPGDDKLTSKKLTPRGLSSGVHEIMITHKFGNPPKKIEKVKVNKRQITCPPPITMWVKDTLLKLKNGRIITGRLVRRSASEVYIEPQPGISQGFTMGEIDEVRPLDSDE